MRVEIDGFGLAVEDGGSGVPLVLLHGFPLSSGVFGSVRPVVERAGRVVTVDLRGFGRSDAPEVAYGIPDLAGDVLRVADHLGLERFVLGGHSMGGYVALQVAAEHRDRLAGLVLVDTRAAADTESAAERRREAAAEIRQGRRGAFLDGLLPGLVGHSTRERQPELLDVLRGMAAGVPDHVLAGCLDGMRGRPDRRSLLGELQVPALVMVGAEDELVPVEEARTMAEALPRGRLKVVPEAGHTPTLERPVVAGDAIAVFVRGIPPE
jgi:pimeloyl-ACP methyl ester carboxylesterase